MNLAGETPYPYARARALYEWGVASSRPDTLDVASERLEAALSLFRHLGARPYVERAVQALEHLQRG